ncbi:conserved hypothetical protein, secreted [Candidatus Magnetomorum sp. HK-1]|nr:conserved hypothetical protein, secreted [Candidatus Magnetomorum sp. HK-1]
MKKMFTIWMIMTHLMIVNVLAGNQTYIPEETITEKIIATKKVDKAEKHWEFKAKLSSNFSFTNNRDFVGQTDGSIYQFNINTEEEANWRNAQHELLNKLHIVYGLSKTPQLEDIFKSKDQIQYMCTYLYHLKNIDWVGPFARMNFSSSLFKGYYVSSNDEDLVLNYADGLVESAGTLEANTRFKIVEAFEPMTIRGNLGFFANPYDSKEIKMELKFGAGFQKIITNDGFVLADDGSTPEIELKQLEDHTEAGLELEADISGAINDNVKWSLMSNFFFPLNDQENNNEDLDGIDKLNTNIEGKISSKLSNHISLDYLLVLKRLPLILDEWQIQNGIVVNFSYDLL